MQRRQYQQQQHQQQHQRVRGFEEQVRAISFGVEADSSDDDDNQARTNQRQRAFLRHSRRPYENDDDGRVHSRVMTHPVVKTTTPILAPPQQRQQRSSNYQPPAQIRSRPVSGTGSKSAVARKATAAAAATAAAVEPTTAVARPRASSEVSFSRVPYMGWRRPFYQASEAAAATTAAAAAAAAATEYDEIASPAAVPTEYRGKNLHNFSYVDAKIYSPQQQQQQQQQQWRRQQREQQQENRAKIWWTMETMGAVSSGHSNQMMLATARAGRSPAAAADY